MIDKFAADIFKMIYNHSAMCVLIIDGDRVIRHCNPAICSVLGRDEKSMVGQPSASLVPLPPDEARNEGIRFQLDRDGYTSLLRPVFEKADGTHVQLRGRIFKVAPDMYVFILFPDQETEQVYEIAKLRRDNEELVKLVLSLKQQVEKLQNRRAFPVNVTPAERKIAAMVAKGKTSEEIAGEIHRSVATVKNHRKSLRKKLNLENGHSLQSALRDYGLL